MVSTGQGLLSHNMYAYCNNNPVNMKDDSGEFALTAAILGGIALKAIAVVGKVVAVVATIYAVNKANTAIKTTIDNKINEKKNETNNTVYTLKDPETNTIQYVGRTTNYDKRMQNHASNPDKANLVPDIKINNLTPIQARGIEQMLIVQYSTLNKGNPMNNQINGIRWDNPKYSIYMSAAKLFLSNSETYVGP